MVRSFFKFAEGVNESGVEQFGESIAFLVCKTGVALVRFGILKVDFLVRHIEIAAEDDRLLLCKLDEVFAEIDVPLVGPIVQSAQLVLRIGRVHVEHEKVFVLGGDDAAFLIVPGDVHAARHLDRLGAGEDRRA